MEPQIIEEFRANAGKVGGPFEDAPLLLLHTTGPEGPGTCEPDAVPGPRRPGRRVRLEGRRAHATPTGTTTWSPTPTSPLRSAPTFRRFRARVAAATSASESGSSRSRTTRLRRLRGEATREIPVVILDPIAE